MAEDPPALDWLVEGVMVADQPLVIGGPAKCLKTSVALDLAGSLGTGTPFLGTFRVPCKRRVVVFSGESGEAVICDTLRRILAAKGVKPKSCRVRCGFRLPRLSVAADRTELQELLLSERIEVVIVDPLYLCLAGTRPMAASNLYEVGQALHAAGDACRRAGATLVLVHHTTKGSAKGGEVTLLDLSQAGVGEFARQWLLVSRRSDYRPGSSRHELALTAGGSAGHSSRWRVDVDEGTVEPGERKWHVDVALADGAGHPPAAESPIRGGWWMEG